MGLDGSPFAVEGIVGGSDQLGAGRRELLGGAGEASLEGGSKGRSTQLLRKAQSNTLEGHGRQGWIEKWRVQNKVASLQDSLLSTTSRSRMDAHILREALVQSQSWQQSLTQSNCLQSYCMFGGVSRRNFRGQDYAFPNLSIDLAAFCDVLNSSRRRGQFTFLISFQLKIPLQRFHRSDQ